jgi:hypothetical protein
MARNWTTLPVRGNDEYREMVKGRAEELDVHLGDLVRAALDQYFEAKANDTSFFAPSGTDVYQMEHEGNDCHV